MPSTMTPDDALAICNAAPIDGSSFGVEVGLDLSSELSEKERAALSLLYQREGLILARDQTLTLPQQLAACSILGPVLANESAIFSNVAREGLLGALELLFHNDLSYAPAPLLGGALYALRITEPSVPTRYVNAMLAYERMPADLRARIEGRNALHLRPRSSTQAARLADSEPGDNCAVHALVGRQDATGRRYIFASENLTGLVIGMSEQESDALLSEIFAHLYRPENEYQHAWREKDIVIWDNLVLQHARSPILGGVRTFQRTTIARYGVGAQLPLDLAPDIQNENIVVAA